MNKEDIIFGIQEMIEFSRLTTDIGFANQNEKITLLKETLNLIKKQEKEIEGLERDKEILLKALREKGK